MNFKYYDVLSTLISGVVLLFVLSIVIDWDINDINVTVLLSLAYVMGYMLNAKCIKCVIRAFVLLVYGRQAFR